MQFQVPQFLDVEDKIIGPFTFKQFIYLGGGAGLGYVTYVFFSYVGHFLGRAFSLFETIFVFLGIMLAFGWFALGFLLAFFKPYKPNNKPFVDLIEAAFNYWKSSKQYIWRRNARPEDLGYDLANFKTTKHQSGILANKDTGSRLGDLNWTIDVNTANVEAKKVTGGGE